MLAELSLDSLPQELRAELEDIFGTAPLVFEGGPDGSIEEFVSGSTASELEGCASRLWGSQGQ